MFVQARNGSRYMLAPEELARLLIGEISILPMRGNIFANLVLARLESVKKTPKIKNSSSAPCLDCNQQNNKHNIS